MIITLTGFMGCGKSSVGKALSTLLSCPFTDLDKFIEAKAGKSIPDIFRTAGEDAFRRMELDALEEITALSEGEDRISVLSLGGGTLTAPGCIDLIKARTLCIYLRAGIDTLVANLEKDHEDRPMLNTPETGQEALRRRIETLMERRRKAYEETAGTVIDIDGKRYVDVAREIAERLDLLPPHHGTAGNGQRKRTVWDPLRKKEVALTPEEAVRQWCISELLHGQMKIPVHMMMSETGFKLGGKQFRADILVYDREAKPLAVVECKRPETSLDRKVLEQAVRYNMVLSVKYIIITNGTRTVIFRKGPGGYMPEQSAPDYEEMLK